MPRRSSLLPIVLLGGLAALLAAAHAAEIPWRIPLNYNEGWMAFFAARAMGNGLPLYPPAGGFIGNNYPPLSFFVVGALGRLVGDNVVAGRLAAFAALAAVVGWVFLCARRLGAGRTSAGLAALVFALFNLTWFHAYVAMADPQWLGQAVMLAALPLLLPAGEGRLAPWRAALAAVAMVAGGFVKHNLVALPLAAGVWLLLLRDWRAFLAWAGGAVVALAAGGLWVWTAFGAEAFRNVVGSHRRLLPGQWLDALAYFAPMAPLILAAAWLARRRGGDPRVRLVAIYAGVAVPLAFFQRLGEGINVNGYFEALVAVSIAAGAALELAPVSWRGRDWSAGAVALVLAAPSLLAAPYFLALAGRDLVTRPARAAEWRKVEAAVAAAPGPAACEMLAVCYWAGKGFALDFFNYGQVLRAGASPAPLLAAIDARRFGAMVVVRNRDYGRGEGRLPQPVPAHIDAAYAVRLTAPGGLAVMTPK
jgi:hypothetical protein